MNTGLKQGRVKSSSRMNPQSSSLHRENGQYVDLLERDFMTPITQATAKHPPSVKICGGLCLVMAQLVFYFYQSEPQ